MQLPARLVDITQVHLDRLIATKALEGPHLEFKGQLPQNWDNATKHEFAADTSAFANAGGGDIIFGMAQDSDGQASGFDPIPETGIDDEVLRLQNFLRDLVEPRIQGSDVRAVPVATDAATGFVVVVRIPPSWQGPHRVRPNRAFFIREGGRKREIDVPEIRGLFLRSDLQAQRVRDFRADRIGRVLTGDTPQPLVSGAYAVAHAVPTQAALGLVELDVADYLFGGPGKVPVLSGSPASARAPRLNFEGALQSRPPNGDGETHGYTQIFRNGFFESVQVFTRSDGSPRQVITSASLEAALNRFAGEVRAEMERKSIPAEVAIFLTLVHVKGLSFGYGGSRYFPDDVDAVFDRDILSFPEVLIEDGASIEAGLTPLFDLLWQSVGLRGWKNPAS